QHDEEEIDLPGHVVALLDLGQRGHLPLEALDVRSPLAFEIDPDQAGDRKAHRPGRDLRDLALDDSDLAQALETPLNGRGGQSERGADGPRGDLRVVLVPLENPPTERGETHVALLGSSRSSLHSSAVHGRTCLSNASI